MLNYKLLHLRRC